MKYCIKKLVVLPKNNAKQNANAKVEKIKLYLKNIL